MENPAHFCARPKHLLLHRGAPLLASLTFFSLTFLLGGCIFRRKPAIPWATAIQVRPLPQPHTLPVDDPDFDAPVFNLDLSPLAAMMVPVRTAPPRPHVNPSPSPAATGPVASAEKPEAPAIAPQLTQQESAAARQETNQSLDIAEKNLASTRGKRLTAAQTDLVSKINGFLKDAREAAQAGDWARARNFAKKAQVLSEELVRSV